MTVKLDTTVLDKMTANIRPKASQVVNKYGQIIAGSAAERAPLDTGALRNSLLSESKLRKQLLFILQDGVEYGIFQELGTHKMAAHPFVVPAMEDWRDRFGKAFGELFR